MMEYAERLWQVLDGLSLYDWLVSYNVSMLKIIYNGPLNLSVLNAFCQA